MTKSERSEINRRNAEKSTGPTSPEGKERSRRNALTHGLTAVELALPEEDPGQIEQAKLGWVDACRPQGEAEDTMVDQAALSTLRLQRIALAERAIVGEQVRHADDRWVDAQEAGLAGLKALLRDEPRRAVAGLMSFGLGAEWLLGRWVRLREIFEKRGCWDTLGLIHQVLRLAGFDPEEVRTEPVQAFQLLLCCVHSLPDPNGLPIMEQLRPDKMPPEFFCEHGHVEPDRAKARREVLGYIAARCAELEELVSHFGEIEGVDRAEAPQRALIPDDTPRNRLLLRYLRSAEGTLDRALKSLARLQKDRNQGVALGLGEVDHEREVVVLNEPNPTEESSSSPLIEETCVELTAPLPRPSAVEWREGAATLGSEDAFVLPIAAGLAGSSPGR